MIPEKRVLVYHKNVPDFQEHANINMHEFTLVAAIDHEGEQDKKSMLENAFKLTNHIDEDWTKNEAIWVFKEESRSSSVGDVFVIGVDYSKGLPEHMQVCNVGFHLPTYIYNTIQYPVDIRIAYEESFERIYEACPNMSYKMRLRIIQEYARIREWAMSYKTSPRLIGHDLAFSFGPISGGDGWETKQIYCELIDKGVELDPNKVNMGGYNTSQLIMNCGLIIDQKNQTVCCHS